ncbi:MAG: GNAT family N-acetyltransferase [Polaribacter sp.]|nr:GNAT family N-acetyltransferase [Polaribacter sp.]
MKQFSFTFFPELTTDRLILRQLRTADIPAIYSLRSNKEINRLITRNIPQNKNEVLDFIVTCHQEFMNKNRVFWAMELKETKQLIGTIVYHKIFSKDSYAEIGYELDPKFHRNGYMNEAMQATLNFGIERMKLNVIEAFTHQNNRASIALLEKHQFVLQVKRRCKHVKNNRIFRLENK